jgi:uncharacterized damage-inducible protein DinB
MLGDDYLDMARREMRRHQTLAERAMAQMSEEHFFARPAPVDNSVALILKHVSGNMISRWTDFLTTDGEKPNRKRDEEFIIRESDTYEHLMAQWALGWETFLATLDALSEEDLSKIVFIRGEPLTVLQALNRQITHYPYHIGQIVFLAKHYAGDAWQSLSIPLGKSAEFNRAPTPYLTREL